MKDYVIPYLVAENGQWWSGIDIYNHNDSTQAVSIKSYRHANGVRCNVIELEIEAYQHHILLPKDLAKGVKIGDLQDGRSHVIITGPDNLMITPFMGTIYDGKNTGFGILPVYEDTKLKN